MYLSILNNQKLSPRHIFQPKCGRTRAGKRRQQETLCEIEYGCTFCKNLIKERSEKMDSTQKDELICYLDNIEKNIANENIYVGFNGHGHLRYIQATREGLLKLGIFFMKSSFSEIKYIDIDSEEKTLEWIDPESEETIDYVEIIDNIKKNIRSRKVYRQDTNSKKSWYSPLIGWIIYLMIFCVLALLVIGFGTVISWVGKLF